MSKTPDTQPKQAVRRTVAGGALAVVAVGAIVGVNAARNDAKHIDSRYTSVYNPGSSAREVEVKAGQNATSIALEFARKGSSDAANIALSLSQQDPHMHDGDIVDVPEQFIEAGTPGATAVEATTTMPPIPADNSPHHQQ